MAKRWILAFLLLLFATPALAQLDHDADNPDIILPDPVKVAKPEIPPSQINAGTAVVSPATDHGPAEKKQVARKCTQSDQCALPTPEAR